MTMGQRVRVRERDIKSVTHVWSCDIMVIIVEWPELTYTHQYNKHYPLICLSSKFSTLTIRTAEIQTKINILAIINQIHSKKRGITSEQYSINR